MTIEVIDHHVVYENPHPQNRSRHGYFPGLVQLPSGDLLAMFVVGEAFEAADITTVVSRSSDGGRTWMLEGPIHEKAPDHRHAADFMKPTLLRDGTLLATGYRFHRTEQEQLVANSETDGVRPGDNLYCHSSDEGRSWTRPQVMPRAWPEMIEASGSAIELCSGSILGCGSLFPLWDGSNPSGKNGVLFRSEDGGHTWDDSARLFVGLPDGCAPSEPRVCEMTADRVVALAWTSNHKAGVNLPNHAAVSHDGGATWSTPMNTGVAAQASGLIHWRGDLLLTVHSHREGEEIGVFVRVIDFSDDEWKVVEAVNVWDNAPAMQVGNYATMGTNLRFGQPSLLRLEGDEVLATHWAIEEGQGRIRSHRLRVRA